MLEALNGYIIGVAVPVMLIFAGIYFFVVLRLLPVLKAGRVINATMGSGKGGFGALLLSLAGTLGVGNLAGVASAIYLGGFGAVFWMWVSAAIASIIKYAEILLAMLHRRELNGEPRGGAPYYIGDVLRPRSRALGSVLPKLFAVLYIVNSLFMGGVIQTGAVAEALKLGFGLPKLLTGAILSLMTAYLLLGGGKRIVKLTTVLVPFMTVAYVVLSLVVIIVNRERLPSVVFSVMTDAFSFSAVGAGAFGFLFSKGVRFGVMRGLFSNEAGCGTSPTAHVSSRLEPCEQGFMGLVEVVVDTIVLCSLTAFVVMLNYTEVAKFGEDPILMTVSSYALGLSEPFAPYCRAIMAFMVLCFGFATISCLAHYVLSCGGFISRKKPFLLFVCTLYVLSVFYGAVGEGGFAWGVSDLTFGVMTLINLFVLFLAKDEIKKETLRYFKKRSKK